jgi:hypothetical protein
MLRQEECTDVDAGVLHKIPILRGIAALSAIAFEYLGHRPHAIESRAIARVDIGLLQDRCQPLWFIPGIGHKM